MEMVDYLLPQIKEGKIKPRRSQNVFLKSDRIVFTGMKEGVYKHLSLGSRYGGTAEERGYLRHPAWDCTS